MLQPIKTTLSALCTISLAAVSLAALALATASPAAMAQTPAKTPANQTPTPQTTAAPGTIAVQPGAAAALAPGVGPSYRNRWEVYIGLSFMNGQAGQNLPKRYNMGGGEAMGTYWLSPSSSHTVLRNLGVAGDYRIEAGTTPVISPYYNRVLVTQNIVSGGVVYRGPRNRYVALDFHGLGGGTDGDFDNAVRNFPGGSPVSSCPANQKPGQQGNLGLYCNHVAGWGAAGGSIDFNQGAKLAIRLSPDMIFEHFGTETREFVSVSMGVLYRFGKK